MERSYFLDFKSLIGEHIKIGAELSSIGGIMQSSDQFQVNNIMAIESIEYLPKISEKQSTVYFAYHKSLCNQQKHLFLKIQKKS